MTYFEVEIIKGIRRKGGLERYDKEERQFKNLKEAKAWIKKEYGKHNKFEIFQDDVRGETKIVGMGFSFRNYEFEDGKKNHFIEEHWITFKKIDELEL